MTLQSRKRQALTAHHGRSDNAASSPGFETPAPRSKLPRNRPVESSISRLGPLSHNLAESSPALPQPKQKRVSLRPSASHIPSNSSSDPHAEPDLEGLETDADIQRRENADAMNEIIMAVDMRERGTLGCAYYIAREEKLCLMEDIKMAGLDLVDTLKLHAQPTVLLISSRADEELEDHLSKEARPIDRGDDDSKASCSRSMSIF
jgi:DNA mismatch repair protein MSH5